MKKLCTKCGNKLPADRDHFYYARKNKDGLFSSCIACCRKRELVRYHADPAASKARHDRWVKNNPDIERLKSCFNAAEYKAVLPEYRARVAATQGRCEICAQPCKQHIDHDHKTSKFHGLLCRHCNFLLGHARDNVETLQKAIAYLKAHAT